MSSVADEQTAIAEQETKKEGAAKVSVFDKLPPLIPVLLDEPAAPKIDFSIDDSGAAKQSMFESKPLYDLKAIVPKYFPVGFADEGEDKIAESGLGKICLKLGKLIQLLFIYLALFTYPLGMWHNYTIQLLGNCSYYFLVVPAKLSQQLILQPLIETLWRLISPVLALMSLLIQPILGLWNQLLFVCLFKPLNDIVTALREGDGGCFGMNLCGLEGKLNFCTKV